MPVKRESKEVRQQQIAEAARKVIFNFGSHHLTVKKIAAEVGITDAALYRHFKSKKEILSFLLTHIEGVLLADISREKAEAGPMTLDGIERALQKHFSAIDLRKGVSFQVIAEIISLGDKSLNRKASQTICKYLAGLNDLLAEGVKTGCIRDDIDLEASATLLFGLVQGVVNLWALNNRNFNLIEKYTALWQIYREAIIRR